MKLNRITIAVSAVLAASGVFAQDNANQLERVVITGSNIKKIDAEGASPVTVITRKQIEATGATNTNELLINLNATNSGRNDDNVANEPGYSGSASVGLNNRSVLVLLNGRRIAAFASGGTFVNINSIPLAAIERVEVLKDGGSAIYGSDAMAGVINFITKKNYQGAEVSAGFGRTVRGDRDEVTASATAGFGTLEKDGFNLILTADALQRDPVWRKDRERTASSLWSRYGLPNSLSSFAPSGNLYNGSKFVGLYKPCTGVIMPAGNCGFEVNTLLTNENAADRKNVFGLATFKLGKDMTGFVEAGYGQNNDKFEANPGPGGVLLKSGPYAGLQLRARLLQIGPRTEVTKTDSTRLVGGVEGSLGQHDWSANVGISKNTSAIQSLNYMYADKYTAALNNGTLDPTSDKNPESLINSLRVSPHRDGESKVVFGEAKISGPVMALPAGDLQYAAGFQAAKETLADVPDADAQSGNVFGFVQQTILKGDRKRYALFGELSAPVLSTLELNAALRYDHYSDFGSAVSPRFAARFQPMKELLLRASYSKSFQAPSMLNLYSNTTRGADGVTTKDGEDISIWNESGGNPKLKAEKGTMVNFGIAVQPMKGLNASLDVFQIKKTNEINSPSAQWIYDHDVKSKMYVDPQDGQLVIVTNLDNVGTSTLRGAAFELSYETQLGSLGKLTYTNDTNYIITDKAAQVAGEPLEERIGLVRNPKLRMTNSVRLERGPWAFSLTSRLIGKVWDESEPGQLKPTSLRLGSVNEWDLGTTFTFNKNLRFNFVVKNLLDKMPPVSALYANGALNHYEGYSPIHNVTGRRFFGSVNYAFK